MSERDAHSAGTAALTMRGVAKRFGPVAALGAVDLEVRRGEVHALIGENGAGKSTLMKVLSGAHAPDEGHMQLDGQLYAPSGPLDARRRGVAMIYQEQSLAPHLSVEDNVMLGQERERFGRLDRKAQRAAVAQALATLGHPEIAAARRVAELGPGARQVVEIARALISEVRVLVLDEPTSSLAQDDVERLFAVVQRLSERGVAVIYISHFLEEVNRIADRFTVLRDGQVVAGGVVADTSTADIVAAMAGRGLDEFFPRVEHEAGEVVLAVDDLTGDPLPSQASFQLRQGEILGLAGLVGAGRTELLRALFGLDPCRAGRVALNGRELRPSSPRKCLDLGLGLLSEDRKHEGLALGLTLTDNLTLSRLDPYLAPRWLGRIDSGRRHRASESWIERLAIRCRGPRATVAELSGGNQQKVALARLLHHDVDVLLLDEPTRGVDVASKVEIYRLLGELAAAGKALVVVSSYIPELLGICDRIAVMHRGALGECRDVSAWDEHSILAAATRGAD